MNEYKKNIEQDYTTEPLNIFEDYDSDHETSTQASSEVGPTRTKRGFEKNIDLLLKLSLEHCKIVEAAIKYKTMRKEALEM